MQVAHKLKAFEYVVKRLVEWHNEISEIKHPASFTKLKVIKLHFFASAVGANENDDGLLDIFDNFYALPFGHVESDVYDELMDLQYCTITKESFELKPITGDYFDELNINNLAGRIDQSIKKLRDINPNLVKYDAADLVNLSHKWYSWRVTFETARSIGKFSLKIPKSLIKKEDKFFF